MQDKRKTKGKKQAEEAAKASTELLRKTFQSLDSALFILDSNKPPVITYCNIAATKIFGYEKEEMLDHTTEFLHVDTQALSEFQKIYYAAIEEQGYLSSFEFGMKRKSGQIFSSEHSVFPLLDDRGGRIGWVSLVKDITERKRTEDALRKSEERYRVIVQDLTEFVDRYLPGGILTFVNDTLCRYCNMKREDLLGKSFYPFIHEDDRETVIRTIEAIDADSPVGVAENRVSLTDGRIAWHEWTHRAIFDEKNNIVEYQGVGRDITERKHAEEALHQSEERYRLLTETSPNAVTAVDIAGNVLMTNQRALDIFGHSDAAEVLGRNILEWVPPEEREKVSAAFAHVLGGGAVADFEIRLMKANGELFWASTNASLVRDREGSPQFVIIVTTDMTERKRAEAELLRTQKLDSLALLAGGIAHDFNNLLQGVFGYMSLAKISLDNREKALAKLEQAEKALTMSVNLTAQLLTFSKGGKPVKKKIALQPVIEDSVKFALSGSRSDCRITVDKSIRHVDADEGQIGQLIQNIVMNANEAMPDGGTIEISAGNVDIAKGGNPSLPDGGKFVKIAIKDSGMGIPEQYLSRIFDPYFTTKQKGSGLGLATSYSIIKNHGGVIEVTSELNKGSTFFIFLPAGESANEEEGRAPASAAGRKGKILVMDDEEMVRSVAMEMINALGHEVECAKDGEDAIGKFRQARESGRPFDVVLLDLTVKGGMGGEQAVIKLQEIDPDIKAVVSSGYADNPVLSEYRSYGFAAFLNKPYRIDALRKSLNALLG